MLNKKQQKLNHENFKKISNELRSKNNCFFIYKNYPFKIYKANNTEASPLIIKNIISATYFEKDFYQISEVTLFELLDFLIFKNKENNINININI